MTSLKTTIALDALEQALCARKPEKGLIHHSDHGVQYLSIRTSERWVEAGVEGSVGSVGDSYDNALAESIHGLFKTEVVRRMRPWRHVEGLEFAVLIWVAWYNKERILEPLGYWSPEQFESMYHQHLSNSAEASTAA